MDRDVYFMPLGGGQRVGASCYFLKLGNHNLILDAGTGFSEGMVFEPDLFSLVTSPHLQSMSQINQIYISHAHMDHVGYLLKLMKDATQAGVYMTEITALLSEYQLYDKSFIRGKENDEEKRLAAQSILGKISKVSYMQQIDFGKYKVTFYPAGHIPGAMMMLFEFGKKKILYTGDYSLEKTSLTSGCMIPDGINIDTMIMCGLHAKHPDYVKKDNGLLRKVKQVLKTAEWGTTSVACHISQLSKGIEFLKTLNEYNVNNIPVYLDEKVLDIVQKMERLSVPVLTMNNRPLGRTLLVEPHILITAGKGTYGRGQYQDINVDFSLHEDFSDMKNFIKKINPKKAILVHCAKENSVFDQTIEQLMMLDGECRTQFIFAEEKEIYRL